MGAQLCTAAAAMRHHTPHTTAELVFGNDTNNVLYLLAIYHLVPGTVVVPLWYRLPATSIGPVESLDTDAQGFINRCGSVLSSAGCCYSAGIVDRRTPALGGATTVVKV